MYDDACGFLVFAGCLTPPALYANAQHPSSDVCRSIIVGSCRTRGVRVSVGCYSTLIEELASGASRKRGVLGGFIPLTVNE